MKNDTTTISILGAGNIGTAIARGLLEAGYVEGNQLYLTRRRVDLLEPFKTRGVHVQRDNADAVRHSSIILITVEPQQINHLLEEIKHELNPQRHIVISVAAGVSIRALQRLIGNEIPLIRAMPNTAIAIGESMTCLASDRPDGSALEKAAAIFNTVGETEIIDEDQMTTATALGACGIAFFLRSIRAASQGGIETGMQADQALRVATQTAKGAAALLQVLKNHPEQEIDKVTTPLGCTIAGLNQLEHHGFSSSIIQGIKTSARMASTLYKE
jgi:pyrroline-5-carboxylate reductase